MARQRTLITSSAAWFSWGAFMAPGDDNAIKAGDPPIVPRTAAVESPKGPRWIVKVAIAVAACFGIVVGSCCVMPSLIFRSKYGRAPLTVQEYRETAWKVKKGMTANEVRAAIGAPHEIVPDNREEGATTWYYYTNAFAFGFFGVNLDAGSRVTSSWIP
jgi:hypothetical protein